jgi:hypothetical protein
MKESQVWISRCVADLEGSQFIFSLSSGVFSQAGSLTFPLRASADRPTSSHIFLKIYSQSIQTSPLPNGLDPDVNLELPPAASSYLDL